MALHATKAAAVTVEGIVARLSMLLLVLAVVSGCTASTPQHHGVDGPPTEGKEPLRIYLARHGQTDWNAQRRYQGSRDTALNDTGRRQAQELAEALEGFELDSIYSSALARSRDTALALDGLAPIESLDAFNEQALGKFEGTYYDGRESDLAEERARRFADPDDALDGGESRNQHLARVRAALDEIRRQHTSGQILIVGHSGTNAMILTALLDLTFDQARSIRQANDELYAIDLVPGRPPRLWKLIPPDRLGEL